MSGEKFRPLSDFEWASVARYIIYVSSAAGLKEINSSHVTSFSMGRLGPEVVLKQKLRVLALLKENQESIESFAGEYKDELDAAEMSVLRSLYLQYKNDIETVQAHVVFARGCISDIKAIRFALGEEEEGDFPF